MKRYQFVPCDYNPSSHTTIFFLLTIIPCNDINSSLVNIIHRPMQRYLVLKIIPCNDINSSHVNIKPSHATILIGTPGYEDWLTLNPLDATFPDIRLRHRVFEAWHQKLLKIGTKEGLPRKRRQEKTRGFEFNPYKMTNAGFRLQENFVSPKVTKGHPKLYPIRGVSHTFAITAMLNNGLVPCIVTKDAEGNKRLIHRYINVPCNDTHSSHATICKRPMQRYSFVPCNNIHR